MTIADDILRDRAAQAVLSLPAKHALKGVELQAGAAWLHTFLAERSAVGKTTTADHLMQEAVSWSRRVRAAGSLEAFNIAHYCAQLA